MSHFMECVKSDKVLEVSLLPGMMVDSPLDWVMRFKIGEEEVTVPLQVFTMLVYRFYKGGKVGLGWFPEPIPRSIKESVSILSAKIL